jgi:hypothetical protein
MTTDHQLIFEVERLAKCEKWVNAHERESIEDLIRDYKTACALSRGKDKQRSAHWSKKAFRHGRELMRYFEILSGKAWIDTSFKSCKKCEAMP